MMLTLHDVGPYLVLVLVGFLPTEIWRWLGVVVAHGIDEGSEVLVWVRAVATAVLAGVVAQLVLSPPGALATVPLLVRVGAVLFGFSAFVIARRSVFVGVLSGELALVLGDLIWCEALCGAQSCG
jgi:Branched-chain amino acid transport protein (AzlD)